MAIATRPTEIVDGTEVRNLAQARAIHGATVLGRPGGWNVLVRYGSVERAVAVQRGRTPRLWRNLTTVADFVRGELGIAKFEVDAEGHEPDAARERPDQSARMKARHEAGEHDSWFRAEVEKRVAQADDPTAVWVSNEGVMESLDARIARLTARRD